MLAAALIQAVARGDAERAMQLLAAGADANETNADGWTPLMFAVVANDIVIARALLDAGADVNRRPSSSFRAGSECSTSRVTPGAPPLARVTAAGVAVFAWLDRRVPAVRRHGYLLASVGERQRQ